MRKGMKKFNESREGSRHRKTPKQDVVMTNDDEVIIDEIAFAIERDNYAGVEPCTVILRNVSIAKVRRIREFLNSQ